MKQVVREVFSRMLWDRRVCRSDFVFRYVCRGVPGGFDEFSGDDVVEVGRSYVVVRRSFGVCTIPFHRIVEIRFRGRVLWRSPRYGELLS